MGFRFAAEWIARGLAKPRKHVYDLSEAPVLELIMLSGAPTMSYESEKSDLLRSDTAP